MTSQPVARGVLQAATARLRCARSRLSLFTLVCAGASSLAVPQASLAQAAARDVRAGAVSQATGIPARDSDADAASQPLAAQAPAWLREIRIDAMFTATDNGNLEPDGDEKSDFITSIQPGLHVERRSPNLDLRLDAALELATYARQTQRDRVLPSLQSDLRATLAERLLFVEASADVRQVERDPFGSRVDEGGTANSRTASTYRISPYLLRELSARTSILARHEEALANQAGEDAPDLRSSNSVIRFDVKPAPVGFLAEISKLDNDYSGEESQRLRVDAARVGSTVGMLSGELVAGIVVGSERTRLTGSPSRTGEVYGATVQWVPSPRTEFAASAEHRFFGTGGRLRLRHRTPFTVLSLEAMREPATASTASGVQANAAGIATYLDAILSRSMPDPVERAVRVQNQLSNLGLQSNLPGSVDIAADYAQLQSGATITWVMSTPRTTTSFSAYRQTLRQLDVPGATLDAEAAIADNKQVGMSAEFNRRLSAVTSLGTRAHWSRIRGLGELEGESARESGLQVSLVRNLTPRTGGTVGLRYRKFKTDGDSLESYDATSAFVAVNHRF